MESNRWLAENKLKTIIAQEYVQDHMSKPELYRQVAEDAADLAQACLKYAKALEGPSQQDLYWGFRLVIDLYAGLMNTAEITDIPLDPEIKATKAVNWADKLEEKTAASQEEKEAATLAEATRGKQELDKETEELLRPFFPELEESEGANNE